MANIIVCLSCFKELEFPLENVFSCSREHYYCSPCGKSMHLQCECYESLQLRNVLKSKNVGELTTTSKSIKCLGQILNIWQCEWIGTKEEFHEHFIRSHNFIDVFQQLQVSSVPFLNDQLLSAMTLVRAFDSNFIFYYHSSPEKKMIYFLIFLLDADDQPTPGSYYYELMVKSPEENHCKTKFVEKCFTLEDNIFRIRDEELCAAISFQSLKRHLHDGHIHFSFLIKKNCNQPSIDTKKPAENVKKCTQVKASVKAPFTIANKGVIQRNNTKKSQSIPSSSTSGGGGAATTTTNSQSPAVAIESTLGATKNQPPDYSSINRLNAADKPSISPAFAVDPFQRSNSNDEKQQPRINECYHIPNIMCQAYKASDHKMYKQKYPPSCFSKPVLRK